MSVLKVWDGTQYVSVGATANSAGLAGTGPTFILQSGNSTLPNSLVLKSGSSTTVRSDGAGSIYVDATTSGGSSGAPQYKDYFYYFQMGSSPAGSNKDRRTIANCIAGGNLSTATVNNSTTYFIPLAVTRSLQIDLISFLVTTPTNGIARLGIYTNSSDTVLYPFQAIFTGSLIFPLSSGIQSSSLLQVLSQNTLYWLALTIDTAPLGVKAVTVGQAFPILGAEQALGTVSQGYGISVITNLGGAGLPSSVATGGSILSAAFVALAVRASA